jgi:capsular exopolysaccharide synthesis family protein
MLTLVGVLVWDYLDDRVNTAERLQRAADLPALGSVMRLLPDDGVQSPALLIGARSTYGPAGEAYRLMRTNLDLASLQQPWRSLLVTSAKSREGKSTIAANLGVVLAHAGRRVIVVDADLRNPGLHRLFGLENGRGLADLLVASGAATQSVLVDGYLRPGPIANLQVLTSGFMPPNPNELLQSSAFLGVLDQLGRSADAVVLDGPPTLGSADVLVLAQAADATLLVVDTQRARAGAIYQAVAALRQTGTHLLGGVLNRRSPRLGVSGFAGAGPV